MPEDEDGNCTKCGHTWGPHVLMATMVTPEHGGLIFCYEIGCTCQTAWSLEGNPAPYIPSEQDIVALRAIAQSNEPESDPSWAINDERRIELD